MKILSNHQVLVCFALALFTLNFGTTNALAYEGTGKNPGFWKSSTVKTNVTSPDAATTVISLSIRNRDIFVKYCAAAVRAKGSLGIAEASIPAFLLPSQHQRVSALTFDTTAIGEINVQDPEAIVYDMSCIRVGDQEPVAGLPAPESLCKPLDDNCDNLCPADANNPLLCRNDHLVLTYNPLEVTRVTTGSRHDIAVTVASEDLRPLACVFILPVRFVQATDPSTGVTIPLVSEIVQVTQSQPLTFTVDDAEAGPGYQLNFTRPKLVASCVLSTGGPVAVSPATSCDPLLRQECNWAKAVH